LSEVKTFRVNGKVIEPGNIMSFSKDIRALKQEDAIEQVYLHFGGQHKITRTHIRVASVEEVKLEDK
jgi:large subunit ribosomal protein LX